MWKFLESENYIFHYKKESFSESKIHEIIAYQEKCFKEICEELDVNFDHKIEYFLCDSPEEVGEIYGDNEPCNGFASMPNRIYAVYNETIKCIGYHEDAHIISYNTVSKPFYNFLQEGLAMYFDENWWGVQNYQWVHYYLINDILPSIYEITDGGDFFKFDESITYTFSGAFSDFLIKKFGMKKYKEFYVRSNNEFRKSFESTYNIDLNDFEKEFLDVIRNIDIEVEVYKKIKKMIKKNN